MHDERAHVEREQPHRVGRDVAVRMLLWRTAQQAVDRVIAQAPATRLMEVADRGKCDGRCQRVRLRREQREVSARRVADTDQTLVIDVGQVCDGG